MASGTTFPFICHFFQTRVPFFFKLGSSCTMSIWTTEFTAQNTETSSFLKLVPQGTKSEEKNPEPAVQIVEPPTSRKDPKLRNTTSNHFYIADFFELPYLKTTIKQNNFPNTNNSPTKFAKNLLYDFKKSMKVLNFLLNCFIKADIRLNLYNQKGPTYVTQAL